jgi:hypothetical protein
MRKSLSLILYLAMMIGGSWATYEWLALGGRGIAFKFGGFVALFGAYLLWIDFLSPSRERL